MELSSRSKRDTKWMKMTIFTRIIIGYLAIFIPVAAVSAYAFSQLSLFKEATNDILQIDERLRDLAQKLADSILTQTRYERKYIITKDEELVNQFMRNEEDLNMRFDEAISISGDKRRREILIRIRQSYDHYEMVFSEEVELIKKAHPYLQMKYKEEKEKTVDAMLMELKNLKMNVEQDTYEKIKQLGASIDRANRIVILWATGFILLGVMISILITRSITMPLSFMRKRTRRVARGDFKYSLKLTSPPEIRELAQDFNVMCDKLNAMDKMKTDFFSLMAHELRTPLASIKEGTNLLMNHIGADLKQQQQEVLTIIAEESNRLTDLVNSLLDLSKMEAGMLTLNLEKSKADKLIHQAVSGIRLLAMTKHVSIHVDVPPGMPDILVDEERILHALRNLVGNAVKFTPDGGRVVISARPEEGSVRVSVEDNGPGIASEDLNLIFNKFKQGTMTDYHKIKGSGLGLAIVKHIVKAHGGKVWVESESGRGSAFIFSLPV